LNGSQISAIQSDAKKNGFHDCTLRFGETFGAMVFGPGGNEIDYNVTFADPRYRDGAPAFCEDAQIVHTTKTKKFVKNQAGEVTQEIINIDRKIEDIGILVPEKCGNVALQDIVNKNENRQVIIEYPPTPTTTTTTTTTPTTTTTIYYPPIVKGTDPGIGG
jgi:hypothetical protein